MHELFMLFYGATERELPSGTVAHHGERKEEA